ncbi:MAG: hypothetical protein JJU13_12375 [Balneolaceae bacterium]|nr:hypothetical protein [Balneolaceae bacterium]
MYLQKFHISRTTGSLPVTQESIKTQNLFISPLLLKSEPVERNNSTFVLTSAGQAVRRTTGSLPDTSASCKYLFEL